jgi:hypothetical protein
MSSAQHMAVTPSSQYLARRPAILGLAKVLLLAIAQLPFVRAAPIHASSFLFASQKDEGMPPDDPDLWLYLGVAAFLVLLGGAFAGLTIALMGQVGHTTISQVNARLTRHRTKYTCRSSNNPVRERKRSTPQRCYGCYTGESIGC